MVSQQGHAGRCPLDTWCLEAFDSGNQVISGSSNGSIKSLKCPDDGKVNMETVLLQGHCPRIVTFWTEKVILVLTSNGALWSVSEDSKMILKNDKDLANYALMEVNEDTLYLATINGKIKWLSLPNGNYFEKSISDEKIFVVEAKYNRQNDRVLSADIRALPTERKSALKRQKLAGVMV